MVIELYLEHTIFWFWCGFFLTKKTCWSSILLLRAGTFSVMAHWNCWAVLSHTCFVIGLSWVENYKIAEIYPKTSFISDHIFLNSSLFHLHYVFPLTPMRERRNSIPMLPQSVVLQAGRRVEWPRSGGTGKKTKILEALAQQGFRRAKWQLAIRSSNWDIERFSIRNSRWQKQGKVESLRSISNFWENRLPLLRSRSEDAPIRVEICYLAGCSVYSDVLEIEPLLFRLNNCYYKLHNFYCPEFCKVWIISNMLSINCF